MIVMLEYSEAGVKFAGEKAGKTTRPAPLSGH